jgi:Trp operon repressor
MFDLADALTFLRTADERRTFLKSILAPAELKHVELRWTAMQLLATGMTQREVQKRCKVSISLVTRAAAALRGKEHLVSSILDKASE